MQKVLSIPDMGRVQIGSVLFANKPGDGSAREQAASCQRVLGGCANICYEFATKRYRSNCVNWGMLPALRWRRERTSRPPRRLLYLCRRCGKRCWRGDEEFPPWLTDSGIHALTLYLKKIPPPRRGAAAHRLSHEPHYAAQNAAENRR